MVLGDHHRRHIVTWKLCRPLAKAIMGVKFNFRAEKTDIAGPKLILANHNSDWDPGFIVCAFREQVYFVSSEHLLRLGGISKFLIWLQDPIPRQKGGSAAGTVMSTLRRLKSGCSVCIFPEGNRSWDGVTRGFPPATGKLARVSGATLVTYHTQGAYFANPRWAGPSVRKGLVKGSVAGVYPPETLAKMSPDEINAAIARDLYEDACARQREDMIPFRGRRTAEHLETLLFTCPKCGAMHAMESRDERFFCLRCGYGVRYLPTGFFAGSDPVFDNIRDWNLWQEERIKDLCSRAADGMIFSDSPAELYEVSSGQGAARLGRGDIRLYRDRLELPGGVSLPISEITGMSLRGPTDLFLTRGGHSYQLLTGKSCCTHKYLSACRYLGLQAEYGV